MCMACGIKVVSKSDLKAGVVGIPLNSIMADNFPSLLTWAWCINSNKVIAAFKSKTGLDISDSDFGTLATAHQNKNDVKVHGVNFLDLIKSISFTHAERSNASCPYNVTR